MINTWKLKYDYLELERKFDSYDKKTESQIKTEIELLEQYRIAIIESYLRESHFDYKKLYRELSKYSELHVLSILDILNEKFKEEFFTKIQSLPTIDISL